MKSTTKNDGLSGSNSKGEIVIYTAKGRQAELQVRLKEETVWLNLNQMAKLFSRDKSVVSRHIKNVFEEKELNRNSVVAKFATTAPDGKTYDVDYYNLDVIISVGYRVKSQAGTNFRIWATNTLRDYLVQGYAINEKRLTEAAQRFKELQQAVNFLKEKSSHPEMIGQAEELLSIIQLYANSFTLLYEYDENKIKTYKTKSPGFVLEYDECKALIDRFSKELIHKKEAGSLFGQEVGEKFQSIIGAIYQTFGGKDLYSTIEEKSANLLYLTIKDHPFADGNKRIGSLLFVYFLDKNDYLYKSNGERKINDNTLVALALLIATSDPQEKEIMIKIVTNLLKN
jgi:death-on-curing family protein